MKYLSNAPTYFLVVLMVIVLGVVGSFPFLIHKKVEIEWMTEPHTTIEHEGKVCYKWYSSEYRTNAHTPVPFMVCRIK